MPLISLSWTRLRATSLNTTAAAEFSALETADGRRFDVTLTGDTSAEMVRNLGEPYADASGTVGELLTPGRHLFAYGVFYPEGGGHTFEAKRLVFLGRNVGEYNFEKPTGGSTRSDQLAQFYRRAQFGTGPIDYRDYRTIIHLGGDKTDNHLQETDTISRLVYGFASAYLLTGEDRFLEAAEEGTAVPARAHALLRRRRRHRLLVPRHPGRRRPASRSCSPPSSATTTTSIPMYEQIYALAGPIQTYRVTGDPRILDDADAHDRPVRQVLPRPRAGRLLLAHRPDRRSTRAPTSLRHNRARKNWNSVGDHAPAYLINLYLATGEQRVRRLPGAHLRHDRRALPGLRATARSSRSSSSRTGATTTTWGWQQNRRRRPQPEDRLEPDAHAVAAAQGQLRRPGRARSPTIMPAVGSDQQRGGWYDVVERGHAAGRGLAPRSSGTTARPGGSRSRPSWPT